MAEYASGDWKILGSNSCSIVRQEHTGVCYDVVIKNSGHSDVEVRCNLRGGPPTKTTITAGNSTLFVEVVDVKVEVTEDVGDAETTGTWLILRRDK